MGTVSVLLAAGSVLAAVPGKVVSNTTEQFRMSDLTEERGRIVASTQYQVAILFPVEVAHVALPIAKQPYFKATSKGRVVYLDVGRDGGHSTLNVYLDNDKLQQFDVALTSKADGITRYVVVQDGADPDGAEPAPAAAVPRAPQVAAPVPVTPAPGPAASTATRPAVPSTARAATQSPRPASAPAQQPQRVQPRLVQTPAPGQQARPPAPTPRVAQPPQPVRPVAAASAVPVRPLLVPATPAPAARAQPSPARSLSMIPQVLRTRGVTANFTVRRDGKGVLIEYNVAYDGRDALIARPEDMTVLDTNWKPIKVTQVAAPKGRIAPVAGQFRAETDSNTLKVVWNLRTLSDSRPLLIAKTLFVR